MNDFPTTESKKAMFVLVATACMTQAGLSISEVADRLKKVGYSAGSALRLAEDGAQTLLKTIVPYRLDRTKLPQALSGLVFIQSADDQAHGHAKLLRAILGQDWKPPAARMAKQCACSAHRGSASSRTIQSSMPLPATGYRAITSGSCPGTMCCDEVASERSLLKPSSMSTRL